METGFPHILRTSYSAEDILARITLKVFKILVFMSPFCFLLYFLVSFVMTLTVREAIVFLFLESVPILVIFFVLVGCAVALLFDDVMRGFFTEAFFEDIKLPQNHNVICPITKKRVVNPAKLSCEHIREREPLRTWIMVDSLWCPSCSCEMRTIQSVKDEIKEKELQAQEAEKRRKEEVIRRQEEERRSREREEARRRMVLEMCGVGPCELSKHKVVTSSPLI